MPAKIRPVKMTDKLHRAIMAYCEDNKTNMSKETRVTWIKRLRSEGYYRKVRRR